MDRNMIGIGKPTAEDRIPPPGSDKIDWDIITGPLQTIGQVSFKLYL